MIELKLHYRKWGVRRTLLRTVPGEWREMTTAQFVAVVSWSQKKMDDYHFFQQFFELPDCVMQKLDPYQVFCMTEELGFIHQTNAWCTDFFIRHIGSHHAPGRMLAGMSFHQFITVDTYFSWYGATGNAQYIDRFLAALYLREGESFIPSEGRVPDMNRRIRRMSRVNATVKMAVMLNWALIKMWLARTFTSLFTASSDTNGKPKPAEWLTLFDAFVGDHIADIDAYKALPCMDAFRILNRRIREAKR